MTALPNFQFWRNSIAGKNPPVLMRVPQPGYYRDRDHRAVGIWIDPDDPTKLKWMVTSGFFPRDMDELDDLFGFVCRSPISYEVYKAFYNTGKWPEDVAERVVDATSVAAAAVKEGEAGKPPVAPGSVPGHNAGTIAPYLMLRERVKNVNEDIAAYIKEIGGGITTQVQSDKVANFSGLLLDLQREAEDAQAAAKRPILEAAREVDGVWKPVIALADESKKRAKALLTPFQIEQERRSKEAAEQARVVAGEGQPAPVEAVRPKSGTRGNHVTLRTIQVAEVSDLEQVAACLAKIDDPEFRRTCTKLAEKIMRAGVAVPGAKLVEQKVSR